MRESTPRDGLGPTPHAARNAEPQPQFSAAADTGARSSSTPDQTAAPSAADTAPRKSQSAQAEPEYLPPEPGGVYPADEALRRHAAARLSELLDVGAEMARYCELHLGGNKAKRFEAVHAMARLMQASSAIGNSAAHLTQAERRSRKIIERVQSPAQNSNDSISKSAGQKIDQLTDCALSYLTMLANETLVPEIEMAERMAAAHGESN